MDVYHESAMYWDIGYRVENPPSVVAGEIQPGEEAWEPVCRVHKHMNGKANKALILAVEPLRAACKAEIQVGFWGHHPNDSQSKDVDSTVDQLWAAIKQAEGG